LASGNSKHRTFRQTRFAPAIQKTQPIRQLGYVAGRRTPDFAKQHPIVMQIKADFQK
jgi:hypothetical protein